MFDKDYCISLHEERKKLLTLLRNTRFSTLKDGFSHSQIIPFATYSPWLDSPEFMNIYQQVNDYTLVDLYRCYELYTLANQLSHVQGDMIEIGVWKGGTAAILAASCPSKTLHLFDTFYGVVKASEQHDTLYKGGEHSDVNLLDVNTLLGRYKNNIKINVGIFPDETASDAPDCASLVHIDVDTYHSAKDSFDALWPKVSKGGVVIFDDYGFFGCEGVTQAVHDIVASLDNVFFIYNQNGHAILYKTT